MTAKFFTDIQKALENKYNRIDRADTETTRINDKWSNFEERGYKVREAFTESWDVQDDDHPAFTDRNEIVAIAHEAAANNGIEASNVLVMGNEKFWFTVRVNK